MLAEDGIKIGVCLIVTITVIGITLAVTKRFSVNISTNTGNIEQTAMSQASGAAKEMNDKTITGDKTLDLIDTYYQSAPIVLVTGELWRTNLGYSFDAAKAHDPTSAEYVNPKYSYKIDSILDSANQVVCIRIVQIDLINEPNLISIDDAVALSKQQQPVLKLKGDLIDVQYKCYLKGL